MSDSRNFRWDEPAPDPELAGYVPSDEGTQEAVAVVAMPSVDAVLDLLGSNLLWVVLGGIGCASFLLTLYAMDRMQAGPDRFFLLLISAPLLLTTLPDLVYLRSIAAEPDKRVGYLATEADCGFDPREIRNDAVKAILVVGASAGAIFAVPVSTILDVLSRR